MDSTSDELMVFHSINVYFIFKEIFKKKSFEDFVIRVYVLEDLNLRLY